MPLPKLHPMYKCFTDLRRCAARLDDHIGRSDEGEEEIELYLGMLEKIKDIINDIPQQYR